MAAVTSAQPGELAYDPGIPRTYAWAVFALTFGLLVSDYMSRQVLNAVFPLLKAQWVLSDAQLGALSGIVALMVGVLTVPLSFAADRFGRIQSLTIMAVFWSAATLACGLARQYEHMFLARLLVGVGEAAYGSVGIAVAISVFPTRMRATIGGAFMAGGMIGSVLGVGVGGAVAGVQGWRSAFVVMAGVGFALALLYPLVVRPSKIAPRIAPYPGPANTRRPLLSLVGSVSIYATYIASGLQLFIGAAMIAWLPSFFNRYYGLPPGRAGVWAAGFILIAGVGMIICGRISDILGKHRPERSATFVIVLCLTTFACLASAFNLAPGAPQLVLIACGLALTSSTAGPASAMVANLTHPALHGSAFALLTLANNFLGLAPGPYLTGVLADRFELAGALGMICFVNLASAAVFAIVRWRYRADLGWRESPA